MSRYVLYCSACGGFRFMKHRWNSVGWQNIERVFECLNCHHYTSDTIKRSEQENICRQ
jgi:transcription elongation factor Elf1